MTQQKMVLLTEISSLIDHVSGIFVPKSMDFTLGRPTIDRHPKELRGILVQINANIQNTCSAHVQLLPQHGRMQMAGGGAPNNPDKAWSRQYQVQRALPALCKHPYGWRASLYLTQMQIQPRQGSGQCLVPWAQPAGIGISLLRLPHTTQIGLCLPRPSCKPRTSQYPLLSNSGML